MLSERIRLRVQVEDLNLDIDRALACGLIVNELVTNAFKHAFPDEVQGEILISTRLTEEGGCVLAVSDNGRGLNGEFDIEESESLGFTLVKTLVQQLHGRLRINGQGGAAAFRVDFPLKLPEEIA
jgi:two-component sensor histidine kinase